MSGGRLDEDYRGRKAGNKEEWLSQDLALRLPFVQPFFRGIRHSSWVFVTFC